MIHFTTSAVVVPTLAFICRQRASQAEGQAKAREKESERLQKLLDMTRSSETDLSDKV